MRLLTTNAGVREWLHTNGIERLLVISPHLDDAVLSLASLLRVAGGRAEVLTVFTESDAQVGIEWAQAAGFANAREEHAERRQEDIRAMQFLGCAHVHAGLRGGDLTDGAVAGLLDSLLRAGSRPAASATLCLLPAASGGTRPYTTGQKLVNRVLRRPFGAPVHPEHELVRDRMWAGLAGRGVRVGFYADLPYAWRQSDAQIQAGLSARIGRPLDATHIQVDIDHKIAATGYYPSQMRLILGSTDRYQRRALGRPECVFLVDAPWKADGP